MQHGVQKYVGVEQQGDVTYEVYARSQASAAGSDMRRCIAYDLRRLALQVAACCVMDWALLLSNVVTVSTTGSLSGRSWKQCWGLGTEWRAVGFAGEDDDNQRL